MKSKNCRLCGASYVPSENNKTEYCDDCLTIHIRGEKKKDKFHTKLNREGGNKNDK